MNPGIVGYGFYAPKKRITVEEIARAWKKDGKKISSGLGVKEKAIASWDEDTSTISVEAARNALEIAKIDAKHIDAIYVGSESHPYAVKTTSSIVGEALNCGHDYMCADLEFACKAGTAGLQIVYGFAKAGMIRYGLAIGADTAQGRPGDALEFTAGSGGAAFIVGHQKDEIIAEINDTYSFTTDTPDFWRRQHAEFPRHAGRFTGEPAYFRHVLSASKNMMKKAGMEAKDFDYAVFHQPNGKFPMRAAKILGFEDSKIQQGLLTPHIGNTYSGASMVGLASVLDVAKPGDKILMTSYGSGAGSDSFIITATKNISKKRAKVPVLEAIKEKEYVDYAQYAIHRKKIKGMN
ncbi:MAG: hydroxymethylglutaryl-CoA synthase [Candidatus Diapherotrites archaeon]|uniref:Hydroxymethylglutaryl-CoA synthase n=1 Tax=Candidatus Iainarchaeum sp. TaxID=3101447 RepID=A0A8T3YLC4_9ARCH|nr:hydroxymethylglutaryl-CoA synthase [Candidatus Diapherotrites archaeon]